MILDILDLIGVTVFAMSGVVAAGDLLRDVLSDEVPLLLRQLDLYATAAIAGETAYLLLQAVGLTQPQAAAVGIALLAGIAAEVDERHAKQPVPQHECSKTEDVSLPVL